MEPQVNVTIGLVDVSPVGGWSLIYVFHYVGSHLDIINF